MVFKLNKKGSIGAGGGFLILLPFIITLILTMVFLPLGVVDEYDYTFFEEKDILYEEETYTDLYDGKNYSVMTVYDRVDYLNSLMGGNYTKVWVSDFDIPIVTWIWPFSLLKEIGHFEYRFPKGTLHEDEYRDFINGEYYNISKDVSDQREQKVGNYYDILMNMVTLNPPALAYLGSYGEIIRYLMVASIIIGLIDLFWL